MSGSEIEFRSSSFHSEIENHEFRAVLPNMAATSYMWLFKRKQTKIKYDVKLHSFAALAMFQLPPPLDLVATTLDCPGREYFVTMESSFGQHWFKGKEQKWTFLLMASWLLQDSCLSSLLSLFSEFLKNRFNFWCNFKFTAKLSSRYRLFPLYSLSPPSITSLMTSILHQSSLLVTNAELALTHLHHPKSIVCIGAHVLFFTFRQMHNDVCSPLQYHTDTYIQYHTSYTALG